jgi:hypothetical protein
MTVSRRILTVASISAMSLALAAPTEAVAQADTGASIGVVVLEDIIAKQRHPICPEPRTHYDAWTGAISYTCENGTAQLPPHPNSKR